MIKSMTSFVSRERKSRMVKMSSNDLISSGDCDSGDRQCVNKALLLFRAFISGSMLPEQDK